MFSSYFFLKFFCVRGLRCVNLDLSGIDLSQTSQLSFLFIWIRFFEK